MHKPRLRFALLLGLALSLSASCALAAEGWKPVNGQIMTRWAAKVDPSHPWPEYPRPQLARKEWTNLNGLWDYAIVDLDAPQPQAFDGQILVPFCVESALSGVKQPLDAKHRLWYRRSFTAPSLEGGKRLLLHFGAVDWSTAVLVNGKPVGQHQGGYDAFSFDITDAVKPGTQNELVVSVADPTGGEPKGKQNFGAIAKPGGIMYTPCSGIWQTVWLEPVPAAHLEDLRITPDVDQRAVRVRATAAGAPAEATVTVVARAGGKPVARATGKPGEELTLSLRRPRLWSPDQPFLYDLSVSLATAGKPVDAVESYFGMRKIALGKDKNGITRILLNNKFVFQAGPLDQGFWPDGIYTAPTDEALRYDIEMTRKLGMNMARKHVKVEPARWYYWADRLGLLVWQDMPSAGAGRGGNREKDGAPASPELAAQFERELKALVEQHVNSPSIIMWVVFNEGWGQYDTARLVEWVRGLDPTRLVNNASGWTDRGLGDVIDMHNYPGPGSPKPEEKRAAVLGEFGGLGLPVDGHRWVEAAWGYRGMTDTRALQAKYLDLWRGVQRLKDESGLCAAVYTQTTDCETECNGLMTYDREIVKVDPAVVGPAIARGVFPKPPAMHVLVPTAETQPAEWAYTAEKPAEDWFQPQFDASAWKKGKGGFGTAGTPGARMGTEWRGTDIWVRREVNLPAKLGEVLLRLHHDEDAEVYLNGVLAASVKGYTTDYENISLRPEARAALKPGANLLALHCHQVQGGQYLDAGIVEEMARR